MTPEVFDGSINYYWESILLLYSGDYVEFSIHWEVLSAIYKDNEK